TERGTAGFRPLEEVLRYLGQGDLRVAGELGAALWGVRERSATEARASRTSSHLIQIIARHATRSVHVLARTGCFPLFPRHCFWDITMRRVARGRARKPSVGRTPAACVFVRREPTFFGRRVGRGPGGRRTIVIAFTS